MFPMGFEFNPSGEDLIKGYLWPWVTQKELPWDGVVAKQLYGPSEPWEVFGDVESNWHSKMEEKGAIKYTIYAFTSLSRNSNSKRVSRRAGTGTWGGQTGPKKIQDSENGQIIGQSKMLAFEHPSSEADLGHWTMHEYSLSDDLVRSSGQSNAADLVVCKITKTVKKKKNKSDGTRAQPPLAENSGGLAYLLEHPELWTPEMFLPEKGDCSGSAAIGNDSGDLSSCYPIDAPENGDCSGSVANPELHSDGVWVRPPQIMNHAAVGEGSGDPIDASVPAVPIESKKRAAEVDHPNEQDGGGALKRQKTSGAGEEFSYTAEVERGLMANDDELSVFEAELEGDLMGNDDEESTNASELERGLMGNDNEELSTFAAELEDLLDFM